MKQREKAWLHGEPLQWLNVPLIFLSSLKRFAGPLTQDHFPLGDPTKEQIFCFYFKS